MKVFLDENVPVTLTAVLSDFDVSTVATRGWKGMRNGALLRAVSVEHDVLLTADRGIPMQNDLREIELSILVVPTNRLTVLKAAAIAIVGSLKELAVLEERAVMVIDFRGRRTLQRTMPLADSEPVSIAPVPPFD